MANSNEDKKTQIEKLPTGIGRETNLLSLLESIREKSSAGSLEDAQKLATEALEKIENTESNRFYLRQIRKEETRLYFARANQAMKEKKFGPISIFVKNVDKTEVQVNLIFICKLTHDNLNNILYSFFPSEISFHNTTSYNSQPRIYSK